MKEKQRDAFLAILSTAGIFWITQGLVGIFLDLTESSASFNFLISLIILESVLILVFGLLIYKHVKLSKVYSKYFIILFAIVFILDLIYKLIVIF